MEVPDILQEKNMEEIYLAGGCLWGVQEYLRHLPGVTLTEAGRANGSANTLDSDYDGYAECVKTQFDPGIISLEQLLSYFFEIIDPYSRDRQGNDIGKKYRTGIYSTSGEHLRRAGEFIKKRSDAEKIVVEILPLVNYIRSADEHQDRLQRFPGDYCHIPKNKLYKYRENRTEYKLEIYLSRELIPQMLAEVTKSGACRVGNYDNVASYYEIEGCWKPLENSAPAAGEKNTVNYGREYKLEIRCKEKKVRDVLQKIRELHPYEEPLINIIKLENHNFE